MGNFCKYGTGINFPVVLRVWDNAFVNKSKLVVMIERLMKRDGIKDPAELARLSGMNQPTLHRILSGEIKDPRSATLEPLSTFFRVSLGQLRGEEFYTDPNPDVSVSGKAMKIARRWDRLSPKQQDAIVSLLDVLEECATNKKFHEKTDT